MATVEPHDHARRELDQLAPDRADRAALAAQRGEPLVERVEGHGGDHARRASPFRSAATSGDTGGPAGGSESTWWKPSTACALKGA